jgi:hypothetical protein
MDQLKITNQDLSRIIQSNTMLSVVKSLKGNEEITIESDYEFLLNFSGKIYKSSDFAVANVKKSEKRTVVHLSHEKMDVKCVYQVLADKPYLKKWLEITFHESGILEKLCVESFMVPSNAHYKVAKSSGNFDICLFISNEKSGLFFTLDFPYNDIMINAEASASALQNNHVEISYPPYQYVSADETVYSHISTIGDYSLIGIDQGGYDLGQAESFRHYLLFDYAKPHLQAPQLVYTSIVNQYTEVNFNVPDTPKGQFPVQNKIFYTLTNSPYFMLYPERITNEIDFCKEVSMDFCQVYEGPFEWTDENPDEKTILNVKEYAEKTGIKLGLYNGANNLTAPHFNHYGEQKGKSEWHIVDADGKETGTYCFGSDEFTRWFTDVIIEASQKCGFLMANFDFLTITPCHAKNHNHPIGGVYQQVANVRKCLNEIRSAVPGYVFDSNLGWAPLVPKIACEMDGFYLTDPYVNTYFPSLNATKILDDSRRADMIKYFKDYLTPVEYFRNCEYFVCADSVIHDFSLFEYGILQGLAVTPNLQLGESLALFDRMNSKQCQHVKDFLAKWTQFVKENWEYYHYTKILTDLPAVGQVEIYAHCKGEKGFIFLVNPNPYRLSTQFVLDETIGLSSADNFIIKELYPEENCFPAVGRLPYKKYGDIVQFKVESQSCAVLAIEPANTDDYAKLFGLPACLQKTTDGYQTILTGFQGDRKRLFLQPPSDEEVIAIYCDGKEIPFSQKSGLSEFEITFPKGKVDPEIRQWTISGGSLEFGLEQNFHNGINGDKITFPVLDNFLSRDGSDYKRSLDSLNISLPNTFLGAYVENLLNEKYPVSIKIVTQNKIKHDEQFSMVLDSDFISKEQKAIPQDSCDELWLSSEFDVPFIQRYIPPDYYHHNFIMLNFLKPEQIKGIRAWVNGAEVNVNRYDYWRGGSGSFTYYIDGTRSSLRSGKNTLVLWVSSK